MRRYCFLLGILLTVFCSCSVCFAQQQSSVVCKPVTNVWYQSGAFWVWPVTHTDRQSSVVVYQPFSKSQSNMLVTIDNEDFSFTTSNLRLPDKNYVSSAAFVGDDGRQRLLYFHEVTAPKTCYVHLDVIDPDVEKNILVADASIMSFEYEITYEFEMVMSPNKESFALVVYHKDFADNVSKIHAAVFDQNGNMQWEKDVLPELEEPFIRASNFCLDNKGSLYMPILGIEKDKEGKTITGQHLYLLQIGEDDLQVNPVDEAFGVTTHVMAQPSKNGKVWLFGFFQEDLNELSTETGAFLISFDPVYQEFTSVDHQTFDAEYFTKYPKTDLNASHPKRPWYHIRCNNLFELPNGDVVLCGEHVSRTIVHSMDYGYDSYQTGDILVAKFHPDHSFTAQIVPKNQTGVSIVRPKDWRQSFVSYSAFVRQNDLYLVYNDVAANVPFPGKGEGLAISPWGANNKCVSVCTKIADNDEVSQQTLVQFQDSKQMFRDFLFADDSDFYVSLTQKKGISFAKYPLPQ